MLARDIRSAPPAKMALCKQVQPEQVRSASLLPGQGLLRSMLGIGRCRGVEPALHARAVLLDAQTLRKSATASGGCRDDDHEASGRWVLKVQANHVNEALLQIIQLFNQNQIEILSLETLEPNLESVFLHLTGKSLRDS